MSIIRTIRTKALTVLSAMRLRQSPADSLVAHSAMAHFEQSLVECGYRDNDRRLMSNVIQELHASGYKLNSMTMASGIAHFRKSENGYIEEIQLTMSHWPDHAQISWLIPITVVNGTYFGNLDFPHSFSTRCDGTQEALLASMRWAVEQGRDFQFKQLPRVA